MNKMQFLGAVREKTSGLPQNETNRLLEYYAEMIDEAIEEGASEEEAVARLGTWEDICAQIDDFRASEPIPEQSVSGNVRAEDPPMTKKKMRKRISLPTWAVVLLILTSPVWGMIVLTLLIVLFTVVVSLVVLGGSLGISLFAVVISLAIFGVVGIPAALVLLFTGSTATGLLFIGCGLVCCGLAILTWFLCIAFAKFFVASVKVLFGGIGRCIRR